MVLIAKSECLTMGLDSCCRYMIWVCIGVFTYWCRVITMVMVQDLLTSDPTSAIIYRQVARRTNSRIGRKGGQTAICIHILHSYLASPQKIKINPDASAWHGIVSGTCKEGVLCGRMENFPTQIFVCKGPSVSMPPVFLLQLLGVQVIITFVLR